MLNVDSAMQICMYRQRHAKCRIRPNYRTYPYERTVKQIRSLQITASVLFVFINAYVMGTYLNCIELSMQFKWVPTTYALLRNY